MRGAGIRLLQLELRQPGFDGLDRDAIEDVVGIRSRNAVTVLVKLSSLTAVAVITGLNTTKENYKNGETTMPRPRNDPFGSGIDQLEVPIASTNRYLPWQYI